MNEAPRIVDSKLMLHTYQRRLRHLKSLYITRFVYRAADPIGCLIWFSIHEDDTSEELYRSDEIALSLHPAWETLDWSLLPYSASSLSKCLIRVWVKERTSVARVHLELQITFRALIVLPGDSNPLSDISQYENHLHVKMYEHIFSEYRAPSLRSTSRIDRPLASHQSAPALLTIPHNNGPSKNSIDLQLPPTVTGNSADIDKSEKRSLSTINGSPTENQSYDSHKNLILNGVSRPPVNFNLDPVIDKVEGLSLSGSPHPEKNSNVSEATVPVPQEFRETLFCRYPKSATKISYSLQLISRLQTALRALKQMQEATEQAKEAVKEKLCEMTEQHNVKADIEEHKCKIARLRRELESSKFRRQQKHQKLLGKKEQTRHKEQEVEVLNLETRDDDSTYTTLMSDHNKTREILLKTNHLLLRRQKQILVDLVHVYPIEEGDGGRYRIAGVALPASEDITSAGDDAETSTALGHVAHLLLLLSHVTDIPLHYEIEPRGSRSLISNLAMQPITGYKERVFPLYSRSRDKQLYRYAVFLLNKNIVHLRAQLGYPTKNIYQTLRNIADLLQSHFAMSCRPYGGSLILTSPAKLSKSLTHQNSVNGSPRSQTPNSERELKISREAPLYRNSPLVDSQPVDSSDDN